MGLFNSVPQDRLLNAVNSLTTKWNITFDTPTLTIDIQATSNPLQLSHMGQHHRRHHTQRTIDTEDIQLHHSLTDHSQTHFTYYRYVDNRFITFNDIFLNHIGVETSTHPDFFGNPVELEPVEDIGYAPRRLRCAPYTTYKPTECAMVDKGHASAGSQRLRLSGVTSRAHLIRHYYTYPTSAIERALEIHWLVTWFFH